MSTDPVLSQAAQAIKTGDKTTARTLIRSHLKTNPQSAPGWYMAAFVLEGKDKQINALQRALAIAPDYSPAKTMLAKLSPTDVLDIPRSSLQPIINNLQGALTIKQRQDTHALTVSRSSETTKNKTNIIKMVVIGLLVVSVIVGALVFKSVNTTKNCNIQRDNIIASHWNMYADHPSPQEEAQINDWLTNCTNSIAYLNAGSFLYFVTVQKYGANADASAKAAAEIVNSSLGTGYTGTITAQTLTEQETQLFQTGVYPEEFAKTAQEVESGNVGVQTGLSSSGGFEAQLQTIHMYH